MKSRMRAAVTICVGVRYEQVSLPCFAEARQVLSHGDDGAADGFVDQVGKPETRDAADFLQRGAARPRPFRELRAAPGPR